MCGISQEGRLVPFDQVAKPGKRKSGRNEQEADDPVEPDHDQRGEADRNRDHVQCTVDGVIMRAVIVRIEAHRHLGLTRLGPARLYDGWFGRSDEAFEDVVRDEAAARGKTQATIFLNQQAGFGQVFYDVRECRDRRLTELGGNLP